MHTDSIRKKAMDEARDRGEPVLSEKTVLKLDGANSIPAFLAYLPLYRSHPLDLAERRSLLRGYVYSGLRAEELFQTLKRKLAAERLGMALHSGKPTRENLLLSFKIPAKERYRKRGRSRDSTAESGLSAEFVAGPDFGGTPTLQPLVPPVGTAISLLLFTLAIVLVRAQEGAGRRESEVRILAEVGRLTSGVENDEAVLKDVAELMARALDAVCRIDLLDAQNGLKTIDTRSERTEALTSLEAAYPRRENDLFLRRAFETGETQRASAYVAKDEGHRIRLEALGVGPLVIVPMRVRGRVLGAITITRPKGRAALSADATTLVESVAGRIGLALDNARLYDAVRKEKVELEHRVEERTRDLKASNHELESFCYSVSHDLRTPLRSLDGFSRVLYEDYGHRLDAQGIEFLERIRAATKRMDELITALLTLSRLSRSEIALAPVDVTTLVTDLIQDLAPQGGVEISIAPGLTVNADPRMAAVVFENLVQNAIKFSSKTTAPKIEVGALSDGAIFVRDNGAGFDPQYGAKLFQPFERLHSVREFPGHGIGLATVERILSRHGGDVRAEGEPGVGATFVVRFP